MKSKDVKLTLKLRRSAIAKAKKAAKKRGTSLSHMVESYFEVVSEPVAEAYAKESSSLVAELEGVIKLKPSYDRRAEYGDYLGKKYAR